mmetsp:Transcript_15347/g.17255  ORF Transcript_15347/g.17255 Transcript_15347/m.17255 type:complete len:362 (+) Transcript_15347:1904-2989(+)
MRMRIANRKKDGWIKEKQLISVFLSCFSSSDNLRSRDEILKPLYYIVDECSSEQMEATIESVYDDESKQINEEFDERCKRTQIRRVEKYRSRLFGLLICNLRKARGTETSSLRIGSTASMDEIDINDRWKSRLSGRTKKKILDTMLHFRCRLIKKRRIPSLCTIRDHDRIDPPSSSLNVQYDENITQIENELESVDSDVASCLKNLGISFPHPVYTRRCRLLVVNQDDMTDLWSETETDYSLEGDNFTLPPTKTIVETATAGSWGSYASSSHYPTDEQNSDGENFECSFDSDDDVPFDEVFSNEYKTSNFGSIEVPTQELSRIVDSSYQVSTYSFDNELSPCSVPWIDRSSSNVFHSICFH